MAVAISPTSSCGAPNVIAWGMKTALAKPGATLPNGMTLRKAEIRGVMSNGMLCSAVELGLGEESDGIMQLPDTAEAGTALTEFLKLPDAAIDLDLTPNRGDCFSVLGIARDLAALTGATLKEVEIDSVSASDDSTVPVELIEPAGCPRFAGRLIKGIDPAATSPVWLTERLRRCGLRAISPVVDITNYVMLELGQPLHAYDAAKISGTIRPRLSKSGESLTLLDEKTVTLNDGTMVITDDSGVIGLAGIMGGLGTAVTGDTTDVFFEAAFWPQDIMAGRARSYGMHTDASMRFERGVDPGGQARAIERATELLVSIAGGSAGPLVDQVVEEFLPVRSTIELRRDHLTRLLGTQVDDNEVSEILTRLQMKVAQTDSGWNVLPPGHRFDMEIEVDLIEEVARIHGYDSIPMSTEVACSPLTTVTESTVDLERVAATLVARDYQEVVNYSFIDAAADRAFSGHDSKLVLSNPISSEMSVMRASLLPGLVTTAAMNNARQQERVRIFESSKSFHGALGDHTETLRIAGLITGSRTPEQWGSAAQNVDFFDIKADVQALLTLSCGDDEIRFDVTEHVALQPGQAAEIVRDNDVIGIVGKLHPKLAKRYDLKRPTFVFELDAVKTLATTIPLEKTVSKYPDNSTRYRRDRRR